MNGESSIRPYYAGWEFVQEQLLDLVGRATPEQLALRAAPDQLPVWAVIGHLAGTRMHWLGRVLREPLPADNPFAHPESQGWEDDLDHVRSADELAWALRSSWSLVEYCLSKWTVDMLREEVVRIRSDGIRQVQTRQLVLMRLITHEAFHSGEISLLLGANGAKGLDPWMKMNAAPAGASVE